MAEGPEECDTSEESVEGWRQRRGIVEGEGRSRSGGRGGEWRKGREVVRVEAEDGNRGRGGKG